MLAWLQLAEQTELVQIHHHNHRVSEREPKTANELIGHPKVEAEVVGDDQIQGASDEKTQAPAITQLEPNLSGSESCLPSKS